MPKKAAAPEAPASASKAKKATTPRKSASSTPVAAVAATAAAATLARPSYYNERPTVAAVRATLPQPSGLGKSLRDQYFRTPLSDRQKSARDPTIVSRICSQFFRFYSASRLGAAHGMLLARAVGEDCIQCVSQYLQHSCFADFFRFNYSRVSVFLLLFCLDHSRADFLFFVSLAGVIFYGYKNVSSFVKSLQ